MLGVPSKILQSCVSDSIVDHVFTCNQLVTEYQWAYRKGHSTNVLFAHLTETWKHALDSNLVVGVLFIDFQTSFDSISHKILMHKLENNSWIKGNLLDWVRDCFEWKKTIHRCKWRTFRPSLPNLRRLSRLRVGTNTEPCTLAIYRRLLILHLSTCTLTTRPSIV